MAGNYPGSYRVPTYNDLVNFWNQGHQPPMNQPQNASAPLEGNVLWADRDFVDNFVPSGKEPVAFFINGATEIHIKSFDKMGQPITTIFDYKIRQQNPGNVYATQEDIIRIDSKLDALINAITSSQNQEARNEQQPV